MASRERRRQRREERRNERAEGRNEENDVGSDAMGQNPQSELASNMSL